MLLLDGSGSALRALGIALAVVGLGLGLAAHGRAATERLAPSSASRASRDRHGRAGSLVAVVDARHRRRAGVPADAAARARAARAAGRSLAAARSDPGGDRPRRRAAPGARTASTSGRGSRVRASTSSSKRRAGARSAGAAGSRASATAFATRRARRSGGARRRPPRHRARRRARRGRGAARATCRTTSAPPASTTSWPSRARTSRSSPRHLRARLAARLSRIVRELSIVGVIAAYVLAVGWQPSVVRAGVAGGLASLAWLAARPSDRWHFLAVGALVLMAWMPTSLLEPGFQLSFAAVAAIFVAVPRVRRRLDGYPVPAGVADAARGRARVQPRDGADRPRSLRRGARVHGARERRRVPRRTARSRPRACSPRSSTLSRPRPRPVSRRSPAGRPPGSSSSRASSPTCRARRSDAHGARCSRRARSAAWLALRERGGAALVRRRRCGRSSLVVAASPSSRRLGRRSARAGVGAARRPPRHVPRRRSGRRRSCSRRRAPACSSTRARRRPTSPGSSPRMGVRSLVRARPHASAARPRRRRGRRRPPARRRADPRSGSRGDRAGARGGASRSAGARRPVGIVRAGATLSRGRSRLRALWPADAGTTDRGPEPERGRPRRLVRHDRRLSPGGCRVGRDRAARACRRSRSSRSRTTDPRIRGSRTSCASCGRASR